MSALSFGLSSKMAQAKPEKKGPPIQDIVDKYLYARADAQELCDYNHAALKKHIESKCNELGFTEYKVKDVKPRYNRWVSKIRGICVFALADVVKESTVPLPFRGIG